MVVAFRAGLADVIDDVDWLSMFDHAELQTLIGGVDADVDVEDLRAHTIYTSTTGDEDDACLQRFWRVLHQMDTEHKRLLLKFVTSCSRPPLMGFKVLIHLLLLYNPFVKTSDT